MRKKSEAWRSLAQGLILLLCTMLATCLFAGGSRGDVSVAPTVLVFDGEAGTKALTVKNTGAKEQVYRVSLHNFRMSPDGRMVSAENPGKDEHFAAGMVRYSPRELVLAPGGSEVVRFQVATLRRSAADGVAGRCAGSGGSPRAVGSALGKRRPVAAAQRQGSGDVGRDQHLCADALPRPAPAGRRQGHRRVERRQPQGDVSRARGHSQPGGSNRRGRAPLSRLAL